MMTLVALLLSLAGFACLALAMHKHHRDIFGKAPSGARRLALASAGSLLVTAALLPAIIGQDVLVGIVLWVGIATVAALVVAMALTYGPRRRA